MHTLIVQNANFSQSDSSSSTLTAREIIVIFLINLIFYWLGYLLFNWTSRVDDGIGISILPQQGWSSLQFVLAPIGATISSTIYLILRILKKSGKILIGLLVLSMPALMPALAVISLFMLTLEPSCRGECAFVRLYLSVILFLFAVGVYISIAITSFVVYAVFKFSHGYKILISISLLVLVLPILYTSYVNASFKNRIIDKNIQSSFISLQKEEISEKEYQAVMKLSRCCKALGVNQNGTVILADLGSGKFLLQGPVGRGHAQQTRNVDVFVEDKNGLINISKGVDVTAFITRPREGSGSRPIFLSTSSNMVAFFEEFRDRGDFIIAKLDGGGVYIDESFCPWSSRRCDVDWGINGFLYLTVTNIDYGEFYYKVTPP